MGLAVARDMLTAVDAVRMLAASALFARRPGLSRGLPDDARAACLTPPAGRRAKITNLGGRAPEGPHLRPRRTWMAAFRRMLCKPVVEAVGPAG